MLCCPRQCYVSRGELRNKPFFFFNSFHGKAEMEHESDVRTCVLFVYGDMYYDTALFFKNCVIL
jgi:hypothetical protein